MKKNICIIALLVVAFLSQTVNASDRGVAVKGKKTENPVAAFKTGYYALIIGNNNYHHLPKLKTAVSDAREVNRVLADKYGFRTKLLIDASRRDILSTINDFRKTLIDGDSFLIYYAGHGEFDKAAERSYWLPVDAAKDDPVDWIMAEDITSNIKRMPAKHILIIADSCYAGTLTRSAVTDIDAKGDRDHFLTRMMDRTSRTLMASGGNEPVADDGGRGSHSVFAQALLTGLNDPQGRVFSAEELFFHGVKEIVAGKSEQLPEYNNIRNSGHEGGDFIFQVKGTVSRAPAREAEPAEVKSVRTEPETATPEPQKKVQSAPPAKAVEKKTMTAMTPPGQPIEAAAVEPGKKSITTGDMEVVFVKGGCFDMGDAFGGGNEEERPLFKKCVKDFYMSKFEMTQGTWTKVMQKNPSSFKKCGDNCPVDSVSWNQVQDFINELNERTGRHYRLPTEAEWEYAAKNGGRKQKFAGTSSEDDLGSFSWMSDTAGGTVHPVGLKNANGLGLYDMSGNVAEWVSDVLALRGMGDSSMGRVVSNTGNMLINNARVVRGGNYASTAFQVRTSNVEASMPGYKDKGIGFRLVIDNPEEKVRTAPKTMAADVLEKNLPPVIQASLSDGRPGKIEKKGIERVVEFDLVLVKGGCFDMGDAFGGGNEEERPLFKKCVKDFYMSKFEVTQEAWTKVMQKNPSSFKKCGDNCPVETVSWNQAQDFISELNERTGRHYRLPTEAEWEYAAKNGGRKQKFAGTSSEDDLGSFSWMSDTAGGTVHPVGQKNANGLGLYDMSGNVAEWVSDVLALRGMGDSSMGRVVSNTGNMLINNARVVRGGNYASTAFQVRTSNVEASMPGYKDKTIGFRLVLSPY